MPQRHRSNDQSRETEQVFGEAGAVGQQGRKGGNLQRDIATEDELRRATERPAGKTRVTKSNEKGAKDA